MIRGRLASPFSINGPKMPVFCPFGGSNTQIFAFFIIIAIKIAFFSFQSVDKYIEYVYNVGTAL